QCLATLIEPCQDRLVGTWASACVSYRRQQRRAEDRLADARVGRGDEEPAHPASRALGRARDAGLALAVVGGAARGGGGDIALHVIGGSFARREGGRPVARALDCVGR